MRAKVGDWRAVRGAYSQSSEGGLRRADDERVRSDSLDVGALIVAHLEEVEPYNLPSTLTNKSSKMKIAPPLLSLSVSC
jgi:hypothetical protein